MHTCPFCGQACYCNGDIDEGFDLETDPGEGNDLATQKPEEVNALAAKLRDWQASVLQSLTGADYTK